MVPLSVPTFLFVILVIYIWDVYLDCNSFGVLFLIVELLRIDALVKYREKLQSGTKM